jgi:hypothetical protein
MREEWMTLRRPDIRKQRDEIATLLSVHPI